MAKIYSVVLSIIRTMVKIYLAVAIMVFIICNRVSEFLEAAGWLIVNPNVILNIIRTMVNIYLVGISTIFSIRYYILKHNNPTNENKDCYVSEFLEAARWAFFWPIVIPNMIVAQALDT